MSDSHMIIIGGLPESLINFRGDLIRALGPKFTSLTAMSAPADAEVVQQLEGVGANYVPVKVRRNGLNPIHDGVLFLQLVRQFYRYRPQLVLAYTIKPVIWGGLAARLTRRPFCALITGLGYAFHGGSTKRNLLKKLAVFLYKQALRNSRRVIFQNKDNAELFINLGIVAREKVTVVDGSGVNTSYFAYAPLPPAGEDALVFVCVARLLKEKGLFEYAEAADIVKRKYPRANFKLVGPLDPSPDAISAARVAEWRGIDYVGEVRDVRPAIESAHVYVLPSYHEGLPRSTLEAMSIGRPVITTDAVGCRETVIEGRNGFKVGVANAQQLAEKMIWFIENSHRLQEMGVSSRQLVEDRFDVKKVNQEILRAMGIEA